MIWRAALANALDAILFYKRRSVVTMVSLAWAVIYVLGWATQSSHCRLPSRGISVARSGSS